MRTKHVLMAMALPALFAACTSDDFMEQPAVGNLDGRAQLGNLQVNLDGDAETRFAWSNYKWSFQDGDQFGAAVVDPKTLGEVEDDQMLGNYIFSKNGNGYETTSQMVEGTYLFYSYNQPESFVTKNTRDLIKFDLTTQTADLDNPEQAVSDNQLFISPLYYIEAKNTTAENLIALPLRFIPYYSTAAFRIKNSTGSDFSISQIVLNGSFKAKGEIDPTKIDGAKLYYKVREGGSEYELTELDPNGTMTDAAVEDAYAKAYADADFATDGSETVSSLVLDCNDYLLANGEEVTAYMQVPVGSQKGMTASIIVKVDGVSKEIKVEETKKVGTPTGTYSIASTGISNLTFTRGATRAVFGMETTGVAKVLDVQAENLQDAGGFYVSTNEELFDVLNTQRGAISFYNSGDVEIDDEVIEALNSYSAGEITFSNPISVNVGSAENMTLSSSVNAGINFDGNVTVEKGNVTLGKEVTLNGNLIVKSGKVTLGGADVSASDITVDDGELVLATAQQVIKSITMNAGTLTMTASQNTGTQKIKGLIFGTGKNTRVNITGTAQNPVTWQVNNVAVTLNAKTSLYVNEYAKITQSGNGIDNAELTIEGYVENNGTINLQTTAAVNNGTIDNYGTIENITNNGFITMKNFWTSKLTLNEITAGSGYIDNTEGVTLDNAGTNKVYQVVDGTVNGSNISTEGFDIVVMNGATISGGTLSADDECTLLLLGNNTIGSRSNKNVTIGGDNLTMQIGVNDDVKTLAGVVTGYDFSNTVTMNAYNANMETENWGIIEVNTLDCFGGINRNGGTITYKTYNNSGDGNADDDWQGNAPTSKD